MPMRVSRLTWHVAAVFVREKFEHIFAITRLTTNRTLRVRGGLQLFHTLRLRGEAIIIARA